MGNSEVAEGRVLSRRKWGDDVCLPTCQGENGNMVHSESCSLPGHHRLFTLGERSCVLLCSLEAAGKGRVVSKLGQGHQMTNWFLSQGCPWEGPCTYSSSAIPTEPIPSAFTERWTLYMHMLSFSVTHLNKETQKYKVIIGSCHDVIYFCETQKHFQKMFSYKIII